jgi:hypothetical protein
MLGVDPEFGTSALRLWVAAGSTALLFLFCMLALFRSQPSLPLRAGFVFLSAIFGAAIAWACIDHSGSGDLSPDRRALERRLDELSAQALTPGSSLACLDALAGDTVEAACEKALFVSPVSVASASSYVAARLTLLASMTAYAQRGGKDIEYALAPLRHSLETDHFGFVAHVLAARDACTSQNCKALALLRDPSRIRSNLSAQTLDRYLDHYQEVWAKAAEATPAEVSQVQPNASAPRKFVNIDFPSAASIPPVSIMNPEPSGPVLPGVAAAAAANPNPQGSPAASRRSRKQAVNPPAQTAVQPTLAGSGATEPVWPEPVPPPPQSAAASVHAPVQLNPPSPSASFGGSVRAQ